MSEMTLTWAGVITVLLLAFACVRGYRRGLIKEIVSIACVFLSMSIVWFVNPYVNQFIRENTSIYEKIQDSCQEFVEEKYSSQMSNGEEQTTFINEMNLPDLISSGLLQNNNSDIYQYLAVNTFSDYVAQYLARMAVNGISFLISLALSTILIQSITWMLNLVSRLPVIHGMNKIAGAFLGAAKFLIVVWVVLLALTIICNTEIGEMGLQIVKKDYILNYIYDKDILIQIFMSLFYQ